MHACSVSFGLSRANEIVRLCVPHTATSPRQPITALNVLAPYCHCLEAPHGISKEINKKREIRQEAPERRKDSFYSISIPACPFPTQCPRSVLTRFIDQFTPSSPSGACSTRPNVVRCVAEGCCLCIDSAIMIIARHQPLLWSSLGKLVNEGERAGVCVLGNKSIP